MHENIHFFTFFFSFMWLDLIGCGTDWAINKTAFLSLMKYFGISLVDMEVVRGVGR